MKRSPITDIEAMLLGPRAAEIALRRADDSMMEGDVSAAARWRGKAVAYKEYFQAKEVERQRKSEVNLETAKLHAGITGLHLSQPIDVINGLRLNQTYAHLMAPFLLAFGEAAPGEPHPAPWKSASGGVAVDIHAEAVLDEGVKIHSFDRLNSLWFLAALLRLRVSAAIRVPVISDIAFAQMPSGKEPVIWPVEFRRPARAALMHLCASDSDGMSWINRNVLSGAALMERNEFNQALRALDEAWFVEDLGSAMVLLWSAIEALFRPGAKDITRNLARMVATYLTEDPTDRDRLYQKIKLLYGARGDMAHASRTPIQAHVDGSAAIARSAFTKAIERGALPEKERLLIAWSQRGEY